MSLLDNNGLSYLWGKIKSYVGGQLPNDFSGATTASAGAHGLVPAPTTADTQKFLQGDGSWGDGGKPMVVLSYGSSTWSDFINAYKNNIIVYCRASSNSNPASGAQNRMAFMAYVNDSTNPTNVEFQYYRSVNAHSATQQGDQVYVYKLDKTAGWTVTVRESYTKIIGGTNTTTSYSGGALTINATDTDTWRNISINGVEKLGTAKTTGSVGFINGLNTTVTYNDTNRTIQIDADGGGSGGTDTKVTQTESTNDNAYEVLVSGTASTATTTEGVKKHVGFRYNPSLCATMEGMGTTASGTNTHAEGYATTVKENSAHAEGACTYVTGHSAHAEGFSSTASGESSHTEGQNTYANGLSSHAEGRYTKALAANSHAEGFYTCATGDNAHAEGYGSTASGAHSHAEGNNTSASGQSSHAEGYSTSASEKYTHAEGNYTIALGFGAHAEGYGTSANPHMAAGIGSHVEGYSTSAKGNTANGQGSHAEGYGTYAQGVYSHAEGEETTAYNSGSHSEGKGSYASGQYSHVEGYKTTASNNAHAEGYYTYAGGYGHAEGCYTTSTGFYSHAQGNYTQATHKSQHVFGEYNALDASTATASKRGTYVEIVGNGTNATTGRSNARTLDWNGNEVLSGKLTVGTAPTNDMDVATKKYVDDAVTAAIAQVLAAQY